MKNFKNVMVALRDGEEGQGMVEYGVILALVSLAAILVLPQLGAAINATFGNANTALQSAP